jgi:hypothetical protein
MTTVRFIGASFPTENKQLLLNICKYDAVVARPSVAELSHKTHLLKDLANVSSGETEAGEHLALLGLISAFPVRGCEGLLRI